MRHHDHGGEHPAFKAIAGGLSLLAVPYAAYVATTWYRYGRTPLPTRDVDGRAGGNIERFMATYEIAERHEVRVSAPAELTIAAARDMDVYRSHVVNAIFAIRTLPSRWRGVPPRKPADLLQETLALGWRILAEVPDREIVVGAVTQPWRARVAFRGVDPNAFGRFAEPGYAKIVWTLEAIPLGTAASLFRTETRVSTTDSRSRARGHREPAIPQVLGYPLAWDPAHPPRVAQAREGRRGTPPSPAPWCLRSRPLTLKGSSRFLHRGFMVQTVDSCRTNRPVAHPKLRGFRVRHSVAQQRDFTPGLPAQGCRGSGRSSRPGFQPERMRRDQVCQRGGHET
jgi:hypothetical protein